MTVSHVATSTFANGIANVTSASLSQPVGMFDGDLLLAFISIGNVGTITAPSDWIEVPLIGNVVSTTLQTRAYRRRIHDKDVEPASYTWTFTSSPCAAAVQAWRGVAAVHAAEQDADVLAVLSHITPTVVTTVDDCVPVSVFSGRSILTLGWSPNAGDTERADVIGGLIILLNVNMSIADGPPVSAGSTSKTGTSLTAIQGLAGLLLLEPYSVALSQQQGQEAIVSQSRYARAFKTEPSVPDLDIDDCVGQRSASFRFDIVDVVTGYRRTVKPLSSSVPTLSHDTGRSIKRQVQGLWFGVGDTALLNTISSRLEIFMIFANGAEYPLGRYVFNDDTRFKFTSGTLASTALYDEMFIVDQRIEQSFPFLGVNDVDPISVQTLLGDLLNPLPVTYTAEVSPFESTGSWSAGTNRGYIIEQLALDGDYFSPWFDNTNIMRFIRSFDPATALPTFDFDTGNRVLQDRVIEMNDLLEAPNRFTVISNGAAGQFDTPTFGSADVPASAPHSIANRGFVIPAIFDRQVADTVQCTVIAANLAQRQTIFERVELSTPPDPRHDSYDVIRWQGENWLEISWSMPLTEGSVMTHTARKAYTP